MSRGWGPGETGLMVSPDLLGLPWCISCQLMWSLIRVMLGANVVLAKIVGGGVVLVVDGAPPVSHSK